MEPEKKHEEKPQKITIELTIPTRETVLDGIKKLFPTVEVKVLEEKDEPQPP